MTTLGWIPRGLLASAVIAIVAAGSGCAAATGSNTSDWYVIVDSLLGAGGATPTTLSGVLESDVLSMVTQTVNGQSVTVPTILEDGGQVSFRLALRDPGTTASPTSPTTRNFVTITGYHVNYIRGDGHNTPGVDVPMPFDSGMTVTITDSEATASLILVQAVAKTRAPLVDLVDGTNEIAAIAQVTFTGTDQNGRAVSVMAQIGVNFANWGG